MSPLIIWISYNTNETYCFCWPFIGVRYLYLSRSACMTEDRANLVGCLLNGGGNSRIHNKIKAHERIAKKSG